MQKNDPIGLPEPDKKSDSATLVWTRVHEGDNFKNHGKFGQHFGMTS